MPETDIPPTQLTLDSAALVNRLVVEASAGTGKTYSIAGLVAHALAIRDDLAISEVLITTFTRNAAAELRDRVRRRIIDVAAALEIFDHASGSPSDSDDPVVHLLTGSGRPVADMVRRLRRAETEFDTSTISTIHGVCNRVLTLAGRSTVDLGVGQNLDRLVLHAVNDHLVADSVGPRRLTDVEQSRLVRVVKATLPIDDRALELHVPRLVDSALAPALLAAVTSCVRRVRDELEHAPSYDDLVRIAADVLDGTSGNDIRRRFMERYKIAFVDEAQDTDDQQWRLFHSAFPEVGADGRCLVAVGDPKQAIYAFRGADVNSYLHVREGAPRSTLSENQRSDLGLVTGLNALLGSAEFGSGIEYETVTAAARNAVTRFTGGQPLELIDVGNMTNQYQLSPVIAERVAELLKSGAISPSDGLGDPVPVEPADVCVLVAATAVGRAVEAELRRRGIPAVSNGTESVMEGELARAWKILLEALERPGDPGLARRLAATPFVNASLLDPRLLDDSFLGGIQERLVEWAGVLRRSGVAAMVARLVSDSDVVEGLTATSSGERYLADLAHISDLVHERSGGDGITATRALELTAELEKLDKSAEVVSRRVESDSSAVQIMTIHSAKGLQFPVVVVADLWKVDKNMSDVPVYRIKDSSGPRRRVDLGWIIGDDFVDPESKEFMSANQAAERARLFYVAMTRAKHHVSLIHTSGTDEPSVVDRCSSFDEVRKIPDLVGIRRMSGGARTPATLSRLTPVPLSNAIAPVSVRVELARTSFSGITDRQAGRLTESAGFRSPGAGLDEESPDVSGLLRRAHRYAGDEVPIHPTLTLEMPFARVPGGTHFGTTMHSVYEEVDPSTGSVFESIRESVSRHATSPALAPLHAELVRGVQLSLVTPLGGPFGSTTLTDFGAEDRLNELNFEMSVARLSSGVTAADIGRVLVEHIDSSDPLADYAHELCDRSFEIPLGGAINGSIDVVLRRRTDDGDLLYITDYKTNRLDVEGDACLIDAYRPDRLREAMTHHHYPLQALIYGTAMHRYLRLRRPGVDGPRVAGVAYFFVRGMVGPSTPGAAEGRPHGVFHWTPPDGLWDALSDRLSGVGVVR